MCLCVQIAAMYVGAHKTLAFGVPLIKVSPSHTR